MGLDRFELLELRRDDGIKTFHAREVSTARPVQVHVFANGLTPENLSLLTSLDQLPAAERRRVIDRGQSEGTPYVVTDRLAGFASLQEWVKLKARPAISHAEWDHRFHELFTTEEEPTAAFAITPLRPEKVPEPIQRSAILEQSPILWMVLGVIAALFFLVLIVAVIAFRPR